MAGSRLVVNNRVMLRGAANHAAIGTSRLLYIANREGAVAEKTEDDLRIEAENERMAKLGYIELLLRRKRHTCARGSAKGAARDGIGHRHQRRLRAPRGR